MGKALAAGGETPGRYSVATFQPTADLPTPGTARFLNPRGHEWAPLLPGPATRANNGLVKSPRSWAGLTAVGDQGDEDSRHSLAGQVVGPLRGHRRCVSGH